MNKYIYPLTAYIFITLILCVIIGSFLLIEINGGIALCYAFIVHFRSYRINREKGSRLILTGIIVSLFSILVHLARLSLHEYFNEKDLAHVIMIIALFFIGNGARLNAALVDRRKAIA